MIKNKTIIALVPARGGSKGIKLKNLKKINGKSLIQLVSNFIDKCKFIDYKIISSDHKKIINIGKELNFLICKRPKKLSGDRISDYKVILNAINILKNKFKLYPDYIVYLQPTSPMRRKRDLQKGISQIINKNYDAVWTISKLDKKFHPLKILDVKNKKIVINSLKGKKIIARQMLDEKYIRNGIFYIVNVKSLMKQKTMYMKKILPFLINYRHVNIDTLSDLKMARDLLYLKN